MSRFPKQRIQNILCKLHRQKNSHDVKADILVFQINPVGVELFSLFSFFFSKHFLLVLINLHRYRPLKGLFTWKWGTPGR